MKKAMKIFAVTRLVIPAALAAAAVLVLAACAPVVGPGDSPAGTVPDGKGLVTIHIAGAARALVPDSVLTGVFTSYDLTFTPATGNPVVFNELANLTGIVLDAGTYDLTLTAYVGTGEGRKSAATGSVDAIVVAAGQTKQVEVALTFQPGAGTGTLAFTVTRPESVPLTGAQFEVKPLHDNGTSYGADWLAALYQEFDGEIKTTQASSETIESGYYEVRVTLSTGETEAVKYDVIHIGAGQTTTLNWTFLETDFFTAVESIWVVGAMNSWELPGTPMTAETNGTFTWEGPVSGGKDFRFSLLDTSEWPEEAYDHKDNQWRGHWFAPGSTVDSVTVGDYGFDYYHYTNPGNNKWVLADDGYYRFVVDPQAKTVTVSKPEGAVPLSPPASVALSDIGIATWGTVEHAVSYTAQLYKDGTPVEEAVYTGTGTSKDFLSAMQDGGNGSYTVKVIAVGDGTDYSNSPEAPSGSQTVSTKTTVPNVWWFETTKARWVNVDGDSNYTVQLYNGESKVGGPVSVDRENVSNPGGGPLETITTYDLTAAMSEFGSYTFGVVTKGNGYLILDAVEKKIEDPYVNGTNQLSAPANLRWTGNIAEWDAVPNATGYSVQLYKNEQPEGEAVPVAASETSHDFSPNVTGSGVYTFTVTAIGDGGATSSDSAPADSADTTGGGGSLTVGSTASITFTAADESGNLTVGGAVSKISKTTGTTSLALTVSGTGFTGFTWIVDGRSITTSGNGITLGEGGTTFTIDATDPAIRLGGHSVTVYASKGGVPWSPKNIVSFTVER